MSNQGIRGQVITIIWFTAFNNTYTEVFVEGKEESVDYYKLKVALKVGIEISWIDGWQFRPGMEGKALDVKQEMKIKPIVNKVKHENNS